MNYQTLGAMLKGAKGGKNRISELHFNMSGMTNPPYDMNLLYVDSGIYEEDGTTILSSAQSIGQFNIVDGHVEFLFGSYHYVGDDVKITPALIMIKDTDNADVSPSAIVEGLSCSGVAHVYSGGQEVNTMVFGSTADKAVVESFITQQFEAFAPGATVTFDWD